MINFRYHLVSLTAIFLALGLGIAMGATVVEQAIVETLEEQVDRVGRRTDSVDATNDRLAGELDEWDLFGDQAGDTLIAARLTDVPVVIVTFVGVDRDAVGELDTALRVAGARVQAEIILGSRFDLGDAEATSELARIVESSSTLPNQVRLDAIARMVGGWTGTGPSNLLAELQASDFIEVRPPIEGEGSDLPFPEAGTRFLVASSAAADIANPILAAPLVGALGGAGLPVLAADLTVVDENAPDAEPEDAAPFVVPIRADEQLRGRVSTVDHAAGFRGRTAVVLALVELGEARVGQYGTAPGAERLLPD